MRSSNLLIIVTLLLIIGRVQGQTTNKNISQNTWTYTYIKAKEGQKENLRQFLKRNWFAMDSIAVQQGLFNDYQLIRNNKITGAKWDFIVAVEYFTTNTYADIEADWLKIKHNHQTVLIDGKNFPELGDIVDSQQLIFDELKDSPACSGVHYDDLKPYLGMWAEYVVVEGEENLIGHLKIEIDPYGCSLRKEFELLSKAFSYSTLGYFDTNQNAWIETYSSGGMFRWTKDEDEFLLVNMQAVGRSQHRNRWTKPQNGIFKITEERSSDKGKTWKVMSTTIIRKNGD